MHYFPIKEFLINDLHLEGYIITKSERIVPTNLLIYLYTHMSVMYATVMFNTIKM